MRQTPTMRVTFIGGPLCGAWREVPRDVNHYAEVGKLKDRVVCTHVYVRDHLDAYTFNHSECV